MKSFIALASIVGAISAATVCCAKQASCHDSHKHPKPPKEAIEICEGKPVDSVCQMQSIHGHLVSGKCKNTPDEKYFACKPDQEPRQERKDK